MAIMGKVKGLNMNDREERIITALAEIKAEQVMAAKQAEQTNIHLNKINGSMARHFDDDRTQFAESLVWRNTHDRTHTRAEGILEGKTLSLSTLDKILLRATSLVLFAFAAYAFVVGI